MKLLGDSRKEMVKDFTGFANAAGGTMIYGVVEDIIDNIGCAAGIDPVPVDGANSARISEIIKSNTSPPLNLYQITELSTPEGRVVVVEIEASGTAHQNLLDHRYYQRSGSTTQPMTDYQIRDVMNRRSKPEALVEPRACHRI